MPGNIPLSTLCREGNDLQITWRRTDHDLTTKGSITTSIHDARRLFFRKEMLDDSNNLRACCTLQLTFFTLAPQKQ